MEKIKAEELLKILESLKSGSEYINFQEKIINTNLKIVGVKAPKLRNFAKDCFKNDRIIEFNTKTDKYFEAVLLEGLIIAFEQDKQQLKNKLNAFFAKMDNWAVVDMICSSLVAFKKGVNEDDFKYFVSLLNSEHSFTVRFGIVGLMKYFINKIYLDRLLDALNGIKCSEYYVEMGVAWLISEILIKNPQKSKENMQKIFKINHFNKFVINKSIQKACESFRIDKNIKNVLREMKIK